MEEMCVICDTNGHITSACPTLPTIKDLLQDEEKSSINALNPPPKQYNSPYSNTYNLRWQNHLNFSWKGTDNQDAPQDQHGYPNQPKQILETMAKLFPLTITNKGKGKGKGKGTTTIIILCPINATTQLKLIPPSPQKDP